MFRTLSSIRRQEGCLPLILPLQPRQEPAGQKISGNSTSVSWLPCSGLPGFPYTGFSLSSEQETMGLGGGMRNSLTEFQCSPDPCNKQKEQKIVCACPGLWKRGPIASHTIRQIPRRGANRTYTDSSSCPLTRVSGPVKAKNKTDRKNVSKTKR